MRILAVSRAEQFSPNSVERDWAIFQAVIDRLRRQGDDVSLVNEDNLDYSASSSSPDLILTMARKPETLRWLASFGVPCINAPEGIANCAKSHLDVIMERIGTPVPPKEGLDGYWLKRGDAAAQSQDDVVYVADRQALENAIQVFVQRGISDYVVSAHVKGDLVKFYAVKGGFFRYYYPTDDGQTKFDDERHNGQAHHYPFDSKAMQQDAARLAEAVGVEVYGGDCIVRADGSYCFIDFNDWPSFSRCREEAAEAIARLVNS
jgi:glutathione synthase/RimK-type ligase-like ATP-grasp enzyme